MWTDIIFWSALLTAGILLLAYIGAESAYRKHEQNRYRHPEKRGE